MNRVKGKTVLVTGASSGIGEGCARRFAESGANLVLVARREERLRELKAGLEKEFNAAVKVHRLDVRDREAVAAFSRTLEKDNAVPDVLINNAGLAAGLEKFYKGDFEDWDRMIDTNIKGILNVSRYVVPLMVRRDSGHIINIGSVAGHMVYPGGNVYNATKYAVRALNEAMAVDLVGTRIRVSSIDPGAAATEFSVVRFHGDDERAKGVYQGFEPLTGDDVAEAVFFVANAPEHVNVLDLVILPTAQRNPYVLHREEG